MKYLIINGSPRKKNTWKMVKQATSNLKGEFEEVHLIKENIPPCNGCYKCFEKGEEACPHYDRINPLMEKLKECDGLIIASPVYAMNVTGLLKNFIDHTAYLYHRPAFFDKKALVIVSTAGAGQKKVATYIDETLRHWGFNKVYCIPIACGGKDEIESKKIDKVARKFKKDTESFVLHSPKIMDIIFYQAWRAMAVKKSTSERDAQYWRETGMIDNDFSPKVKLGIAKKAIAKIMFFIMKKVI